MPEEIKKDEVKHRIVMLFNLSVHTVIRDQQWAYNITSLPPAVMIYSVFMFPFLCLYNVFTHVFEGSWVGSGGILHHHAV